LKLFFVFLLSLSRPRVREGERQRRRPEGFFLSSDDDCRYRETKLASASLSFLLCSLQYPSPASIKTADRRAKGGGGGERKYKERERESPLVSPSSREGTNALLRDDSLSRLLTLLSRLCVSARDFPLLSKGTLPIYREQPREARGGEKEGRAKERGARSRLGRFFETKSKAKERVNAGVGRKKRGNKKLDPDLSSSLLSLSVLPASIDRKRSP
jgi:hypothetical protein